MATLKYGKFVDSNVIGVKIFSNRGELSIGVTLVDGSYYCKSFNIPSKFRVDVSGNVLDTLSVYNSAIIIGDVHKARVSNILSVDGHIKGNITGTCSEYPNPDLKVPSNIITGKGVRVIHIDGDIRVIKMSLVEQVVIRGNCAFADIGQNLEVKGNVGSAWLGNCAYVKNKKTSPNEMNQAFSRYMKY